MRLEQSGMRTHEYICSMSLVLGKAKTSIAERIADALQGASSDQNALQAAATALKAAEEVVLS